MTSEKVRSFISDIDGRWHMVTYDEHEARLWLLGHYTFAWRDLDGVWIHEDVWCDESFVALQECKGAASTFGTGEYRFYGSSYRHESMWIDESHMLYVTKDAYAKTSRDFKGVGKNGMRSFMPPLDLDYSTCLLCEGAHFKIV